tara:strand:- start:120 stop:308 length:189 start_codon:yes stop_codon:yes gene_type:complete
MMKKRLEIGKLLKGDKRLDDETYEEYKERRKLENSLLRDYGKGILVTTEEYRKNKSDLQKNK